MSVETVDLMSRAEAERATERIRAALDRVSLAWGQLGERIAEAYQRRADLALGYNSWAEYAEAELKPAEGLAADVRRQLVGLLSAQGMSNRAIAPTVGVSEPTARRDVQQVRHHDAAAPQPGDHLRRAPWPERRDSAPTGSTVATDTGVVIAEQQHIDLATGEVLDGVVLREADFPELVDFESAVVSVSDVPPVPGAITGLDGKTYTRPAPTARKRPPLPDAIEACVRDIQGRVERLARLADDDRLPQNRDKVAARNHSDLVRIIDALQRVTTTIGQPAN